MISQYNKQCNAWRTYGNLRIVYVSLLVFSSLKYVKRNGRMGLLRVNTSASSQTQELLTSPTDLHHYDGNNHVRIGADYETKAIINDHNQHRRTSASLIRRAGGQEMWRCKKRSRSVLLVFIGSSERQHIIISDRTFLLTLVGTYLAKSNWFLVCVFGVDLSVYSQDGVFILYDTFALHLNLSLQLIPSQLFRFHFIWKFVISFVSMFWCKITMELSINDLSENVWIV